MSDEKPDDNAERMRRLYARLHDDEMAFVQDLAHPFKGDGPLCAACLRPTGHPLHEKAQLEEGE